jgi:photosystem II stability/assembly factor-like uncharacterized protein
MILVFCSFLFTTFIQDEFYWKNAPSSGTKIYQVIFYTEQQGIAVSQSGEILKTFDNGVHWQLETDKETVENPNDYLWKADIYCSVMRTNDGGKTWQPYIQEQQDHFCTVYFYDKNTGWKVAEEFLTKVVTRIDEQIRKGEIDVFIDKPHQCTEYYTDMNSGWALGWCVMNFRIR